MIGSTFKSCDWSNKKMGGVLGGITEQTILFKDAFL